MAITSRQQLIDYCLRKLGSPVLQVNIAQEQIEDRIDEALQYYQEYHSEAIERQYLKHVITASHVQLTSNVAQTFTHGETVVGSVSNSAFVVYDTPELNKIRTLAFIGTFIVGETLTGQTSGVTAVIAPSGIFIGDTQNKYITVSESLINISKIFPLGGQGTAGDYMFDVRYQQMKNDITNLNSTSAGISYYTTTQQYIALMDFTFNTQTSYRFNRNTNKINLDIDWSYALPDAYMIIEGFVALDPSTITNIFNDVFIKRYAVALMKMQWGQNLSKYTGLELPGGVKFDGQRMVTEAAAELKELEDSMMDKYSSPLGFYCG